MPPRDATEASAALERLAGFTSLRVRLAPGSMLLEDLTTVRAFIAASQAHNSTLAGLLDGLLNAATDVLLAGDSADPILGRLYAAVENARVALGKEQTP